MILYDMHVHTKGISKCSLLSPEQLCDALKNEGTGGFVLTNHYGKRHCDMDFPLWLEKYRDEFYRVKEIAAQRGLRALFGIEVTLGSQDFLLYGVTPDSLFHSGSRPLWAFSLKELSDFCYTPIPSATTALPPITHFLTGWKSTAIPSTITTGERKPGSMPMPTD